MSIVAHNKGADAIELPPQSGIALDEGIYERVKGLLGQPPAYFEEVQSKYKKKSIDILGGVVGDVEGTIREAVNDAISNGTHVRDSALEVSKRLSALGVNPAKPHHLETLFRTQTQIAYSAGRWQADHDPDVEDIIWGYEYVTVGDDRVRPAHAKLEGVKLPKGDKFWKRFWPPNGWNCRCQAIPILERIKPKQPPKGVQPDKGFDYNAGEVFNGKAEIASVSKIGSYAPSDKKPFAAIGERVKQLIREKLSNAAIVKILHKEHPESSVSSSTVSYYRLEMTKN